MSFDPDLERRLAESLRTGIDPVRPTRDLAEGAVARADKIRARRASGTVLLAAASALLVVTPLAWNRLGDQHHDAAPAATSAPSATPAPGPSTVTASPEETSEPSTTRTPAEVPAPAPSSTAPAPIPRGDADATTRIITVGLDASEGDIGDLAYRFGSDLHVDGTTRPLGTDKIAAAHLLAGERTLVISGDGEGRSATVLDRDGDSVATVRTPTTGTLNAAATLDGSMFVLEEDGGNALSDESTDPATTGPMKVFDASGRLLVTKEKVLNRARVMGFAGGRVVIANDDPAVGRSFVWDLDANLIERLTDSGVVRAVDEASGTAAIEAVGEDGEARCTTIADITTGTAVPISMTCGHVRPLALSPGGRYLLAQAFAPGESEGSNSPATLRLVDTWTGEGVVTYSASRTWGGQVRVEEDGSVVLEVTEPVDGGASVQASIVRCTVDGDCERLVDITPVPANDDPSASPYRLVGP